jgi:MoxR-like ATPase
MSDVMDGMVIGDWNVLSEINRTGEDVQAEFNEPLENKQKTLHQQVIRGHPDSRFIATVNPVKGEGRGIYEGKVMSGEFMNRFTNKVHLHYLPPDEEAEVLMDYGPDVDDTVIDRLVALSTDIRRDYGEEHGVVPFPVTTRALIRMVRHLQFFPGDLLMLRSLFWRKAYWLDDLIHPPVARKLVGDLLDLHDITDQPRPFRERSHVACSADGDAGNRLRIGSVSHPLGPGGPYVPDTVIEEVQQNLADLEWLLKDMVLKENILLIGEAGVGKNKLESYLAHLLRSNLLVLGMSGETRVSDLLTYRSFGEEEAGRTGDTSTLGLRALTDTEQQWIIVLDEANKAHPGVLVSFNDLLQDRLVRLPGGREASVRATICVNINPNRPPYEVNDFSFEFMDRFSIHTIVHLPADQAVDVLTRKYPDADLDFIRDVVNGYYTLNPVYSAGVLFEPVTMRNEEAAIERGLQYPERACNLIDLLSVCYGPRDSRELQAIHNTLQAAGFDRSVLPSSIALEKYRESWEADQEDEGKALALAGTFRSIGKPSAARAILHEMISRHPGRDWLYFFRSAGILLDSDRAEEAANELRKGFTETTIVRMNNRVDYRVLHARIRISPGKFRLSVEAQNVTTGRASLIISGEGNSPDPLIRRSSGEYFLTFTDTDNDLFIYEQTGYDPDRVPEPDPDIHDARNPAPHEGKTGKPPVLLTELVREGIALNRSGSGFHQQICQLPSPPWMYPGDPDGSVIRELRTPEGDIRLTAFPGRGWSVVVSGQGNTARSNNSMEIGWIKSEETASGRFFFTSGERCRSEVPVSTDPALHIAYSTLSETFLLVLPDDLARIVRVDGAASEGRIGTVYWSIHSPIGYQEAVLRPLYQQLCPRLERLFRYAHRISGSRLPGAGDILYAVKPDSGLAVSLVLDTSGMGPVMKELPCGENTEETWYELHEDMANPDICHFPAVIPFPHLDTCEAWRDRASSAEMQAYLREIRAYVAAALFHRTTTRDLAYEGKACSIIRDFGSVVIPVASTGESGSLSRGDILVRIDHTADAPYRSRSVFIVKFVQSGNGEQNVDRPVIRGFWLGEKNPIATGDLEDIMKNFGRIVVKGDEKYLRIIRHLSAAWQESNRPFAFSRAGNRADPVIRYENDGLILIYHSLDRRFRLEVDSGNGDGTLSIEETGYPAGSAVVSTGSGVSTKWQGLPLVDVCMLPSASRIVIVVEDDFHQSLVHNRMIGKRPSKESEQGKIEFVPRSEAECRGLIYCEAEDPGTMK